MPIDTDLRATFEEFLLAASLLQSLPTPTERLINGFWRRGQPTLQDRQGKPNRSFAAVVGQFFGAVEFIANILRHTLVQVRFTVGKLVFYGVGLTLRKQRTTVKLE